MNRIILGLVVVGVMFANGFAQKKDNLDVYVVTGYGFGMGGYLIGQSYTGTSATPASSPSKKQDHFLNLGTGIKIEVGADYKLMDHLYGQLGFNYNIGVPGGTIKEENTATNITYKNEYGFSMWGMKVMLKPTFQVLDLFDVYTNFGMGLFFGNSTTKIARITTAATSTVTATDSYDPSFAIIGGIGFNYPLSPSMILFGELHCEQMNFNMNKTEFTSSTFSNYDNNYNNHTVQYEANATDRNPPAKIPGTNVAIRVGVKFPIF